MGLRHSRLFTPAGAAGLFVLALGLLGLLVVGAFAVGVMG